MIKHSSPFGQAALAAATLAVLTACGGGSASPAPEARATPEPEPQVPASPAPSQAPNPAASAPVAPAAPPLAPITTAPSPAPARRAPIPEGASTSPPTEAPTAPKPQGTDPPPSGRSLNWWGTPPWELFDQNNACTPQPGCRIPDGDLAVWNRQCPPVGDPARAQCYVPLSFEPQVRPEVPSTPGGQPPGAVRPDPMTATQQEIDEWNSHCLTARCLVTPGRLP